MHNFEAEEDDCCKEMGPRLFHTISRLVRYYGMTTMVSALARYVVEN